MSERGKAVDALYVIETKGEHVIGDIDTQYKEALAALCNQEAKKADPRKLSLAIAQIPLHCSVLKQSEWERRLNEVFG
ncbi:MAG: hypothetical protein Q7T01_04110 [bacterium]|nr:hypothetical protein [bacterium]